MVFRSHGAVEMLLLLLLLSSVQHAYSLLTVLVSLFMAFMCACAHMLEQLNTILFYIETHLHTLHNETSLSHVFTAEHWATVWPKYWKLLCPES